MARTHGKTGSITWAAGYSSHVFAYAYDRSGETADGTELGNVNKQRDAGLKDTRGTFSCYVDDTTPLTDVHTTGTLTITHSTGRTATISVIVTNCNVSSGLGGNKIATYTFEQAGDGSAGAFAIT